jgi:hypothetical protein
MWLDAPYLHLPMREGFRSRAATYASVAPGCRAGNLQAPAPGALLLIIVGEGAFFLTQVAPVACP